jgi:Holliday junction resolvasome RuvABC ATP-dependent DNA helicase subunit
MAIDRVLSSDSGGEQEERFNSALRPQTLEEVVGQNSVKDKLSIAIAAAKQRSYFVLRSAGTWQDDARECYRK